MKHKDDEYKHQEYVKPKEYDEHKDYAKPKEEPEPKAAKAKVVEPPSMFTPEQIEALCDGRDLSLTPPQAEYLRKQVGHASNIGPDGHVIDATKV